MAQDNPAQGLIDRYKRWTGKEEKKPAPQKADTSWHDEQVKKANESFRKTSGSKTATSRSAAKKPERRKSASGKR